MRIFFAHLIPYILVLALICIPQNIQSQLSLAIQESMHSLHSLFSKSNIKKQATVAPTCIELPSQESALFHDQLDTISPWVSAHILSHKETPWSHTAWIDVGKETEHLPFPIETNCPLVVGKSIVGIVERVGNHTSLVRLISDPLLRPSVQVLRSTYDMHTENSIASILEILKDKPELMPKANHRMVLEKLLLSLRSSLALEKRLILAKGEIQGALSLQRPHVFHGIGFNYDVRDSEGPARDIRTGQTSPGSPKLSLIQPGDLLVTNGLDGLYPAGLHVAYVSSVAPLEEGGFSYDIEAISTCSSFLDLHLVAVLPARPQENEEQFSDLQTILHQIEQEIDSQNSSYTK